MIYSNRVVNGTAVVSSKGIVNGLSVLPNDGQDWGSDTTLGATTLGQYGAPYTKTSGVMEGINSSPTIYNSLSGRNVPNAHLTLIDGNFSISSPIYMYDDWFLTIEANSISNSGIILGMTDAQIISSSDQGAFFVYRTPADIPSTYAGGGILQIRGSLMFQQTVKITNSPVDSLYAFTTYDRVGVTNPYTSSEAGGSALGNIVIDTLTVYDISGENGVVEISENGGATECVINFLNVLGNANSNARSLLSLGWNNFTCNALLTDGLDSTLPSVASGSYNGIGIDYYKLGTTSHFGIIHMFGYYNAFINWGPSSGFISQIFFELIGLPTSGQYGINGAYVMQITNSLIVGSVNASATAAGSGGAGGIFSLPWNSAFGFRMLNIANFYTDPSNNGVTLVNQPLFQGFGPSTGMVSGTAYYYQQPLPGTMYVPVTFNPTSTAAATFTFALGGIVVNGGPGTASFPAGATTGITLLMPIRVQPGWKITLTYVNCTVGQASFVYD